jgi:hypothetical protein
VASDPHRVFTKGELLRDVWNYRSLGSKAPFYAWEAPWKRAIDAALTEFQYRSRSEHGRLEARRPAMWIELPRAKDRNLYA